MNHKNSKCLGVFLNLLRCLQRSAKFKEYTPSSFHFYLSMFLLEFSTGLPNSNNTILRIYMFASLTRIITSFLSSFLPNEIDRESYVYIISWNPNGPRIQARSTNHLKSPISQLLTKSTQLLFTGQLLTKLRLLIKSQSCQKNKVLPMIS